MASTHTISHPTLNSTLTGLYVADGNIIQYRGIKYGTVPERFARPVPVTEYAPQMDCTVFGPICPQNHNLGVEDFFFAIPKDQSIWSEVDKIPMCEFECLNLIVNVPKVRQEGLLPVYINIHGGANMVGFASDKTTGKYITADTPP